MTKQKPKPERYFIYNLGFSDPFREVVKFDGSFYELHDLSQLSGRPKKRSKPVMLKPYQQIKCTTT
jgi:hypothetical protein